MTDTIKISSAKESVLVYLSILIIFIFYVLTIRGGHDWGGDFSLYLQHAINLVEGHKYTTTGYIPNPATPWLSPPSYPPVFPLILSPAIKIFGLDLYAIKIYLIFFFCGTLLILHRLLLFKINHASSRVFVILAVGLSPWFLDIKDYVLSEFPFMLFMFSFLLATEKFMQNNDHSTNQQIAYGVLIGLLAYLAYGCRSIGVILIATFVISTILQKRKINTCVILSVTIFCILYFLQNKFLNTDASYSNIIATTKTTNDFSISAFISNMLNRVITNTNFYMYTVSQHWDNEFSVVLRIAIIMTTAILTFLGFFQLLKRTGTTELTGLLYIAILLVVPFLQGNRYLLPIMPLYFAYMFKGLETPILNNIDLSHVKKLIILASMIGVSYAGAYTARSYTDFPYGVKTIPTTEVFEYIKSKTSKDAVIVFRKPRILALYTDRKSFAYNEDHSPEEVWKNINGIGADYLLAIKTNRMTDSENYRDMISIYKEKLVLQYTNQDFKLYRILKNTQSSQ